MRIVNAEDICGIDTLLSLVSEGETVVIVQGDRPVGVLSPYVPQPDEDGDPEAPGHALRHRLHHAHHDPRRRSQEEPEDDPF